MVTKVNRRMTTRSGGVLAALVLVLGLSACGDETGDDDGDGGGSGAASERTHEPQPENPDGAPCEYVPGGEAAKPADPPAATAAYTGTVDVTLETNSGDVGATLDATATPCTVNSFTSLASQGYFDDTSCHRLTTEGIFVLQCGDPAGTGEGGPGYTFADELTGSETYPAGTLAMANAGPGTNGSQFFIVYEDSTSLSPAYNVFGKIDEEGLAAVREIAEAGTDNGTGDGAPADEVALEYVEVGEATDAPANSATTEPAGCTYVPDGSGGAGGTPVDLPSQQPAADGDVAVDIASSAGRIPLTLDGAAAPCTVNSFVSLAEQGFFDGTGCHRLTTAGILVLQCGDPTGTGTGGPGYSFADELTGQETYVEGTLAMANSGPDTNGSQFFIVYGDSRQLGPDYTVFGTVGKAGLRVVQDVAAAGVRGGAEDGPPKTAVTFTTVTVG